MRKIAFAPDSYKGTMTSGEVCDIMEAAFRKYFPGTTAVRLPMADGGEGLVDAMLDAMGGQRVTVRVKDPLMRDIDASYAVVKGGAAVIEMAAASGLPLLTADERDPMAASTYGTGQLMADALGRGCRSIILGLGGSATNDGGLGCAKALGIRALKADGTDVEPGGAGLAQTARFDISGMADGLAQCDIRIACDVNNPLHGERGAAHIYAPQKGADEQMVRALDDGLKNLARVILEQVGTDLQGIPGSGAAGGMAAPLIAFAGATLQSGLGLVMDTLDFAGRIAGCDLVVTGEGKTDRQSAMGKVPDGVSRAAARLSIPCICVSGALSPGYEELYECGLTAAFSTTRRIMELSQALENAKADLAAACEDIARLLSAVAAR